MSESRPGRRGFVGLLAGLALLAGAAQADAAFLLVAPKGKEVRLTSLQVSLTWDAKEQVESYTLLPRVAGDAPNFGVIVATPSRPKLDEMPRYFFQALDTFTLHEPMDREKHRGRPEAARVPPVVPKQPKRPVVILEPGIGSIDYKIICPERSENLHLWFKDQGYDATPHREVLDGYFKAGWFFSVFRRDVQVEKGEPYEAEFFEPIRFMFMSKRFVFPLRQMQGSVGDKVDVRFYVQAADKIDLPGRLTYQASWLPKQSRAFGLSVPEKLTEAEKAWGRHIAAEADYWTDFAKRLRDRGRQPATLEWAKRLNATDLGMLDGKTPFNREASPEAVQNLRALLGRLRQDQFITRLHKAFTKVELDADLEFVRAEVVGRPDDVQYTRLLPVAAP